MATGFKYGAAFTVIGTGGVYAAHRFYTPFRTRLNAFAKTSIALMIGLGAFGFVAEDTMTRARLNPERFGLATDRDAIMKVSTQPVRKELPLWKQGVNYLYDHPFQLVGEFDNQVCLLVFYSVCLRRIEWVYSHRHRKLACPIVCGLVKCM